ncbi:DUF4123 domain-containing protein [Neptuniibacter sp. SY11_33]|uniref:DUF4123 domain-containing protein n=1 Tax=Neptuniibacter sp. SY11_33 TaxID=3398215 RepID=UPI0039F5A6E6
MQSEHVLSLRDQIDQLEEKNSEQLNYFCVLSGTSKINGLENFYKLGGSGAKPLWLNTPYADWEEVMPYLVTIESESPFLDWLEEQQPAFPDWGLLVASSFGFDAVFAHFESLTKVFMPSGKEVFFRYWDAPQVMPLFGRCKPVDKSKLMGPVAALVSSCGMENNPEDPEFFINEWPWFLFSEEVINDVQGQNIDVLKHNLNQYLRDYAYELIENMPSALINARLDSFISLHPNGNTHSLRRYFERWSS